MVEFSLPVSSGRSVDEDEVVDLESVAKAGGIEGEGAETGV